MFKAKNPIHNVWMGCARKMFCKAGSLRPRQVWPYKHQTPANSCYGWRACTCVVTRMFVRQSFAACAVSEIGLKSSPGMFLVINNVVDYQSALGRFRSKDYIGYIDWINTFLCTYNTTGWIEPLRRVFETEDLGGFFNMPGWQARVSEMQGRIVQGEQCKNHAHD